MIGAVRHDWGWRTEPHHFGSHWLRNDAQRGETGTLDGHPHLLRYASGVRSRGQWRLALSLLSVLAVTVAVGIGYGGWYGEFAIGLGTGAVLMVLALIVASRSPKWSGMIPGLLGGMIAAAVGTGWREVPSWAAFIGAVVAILCWVAIDRKSPTEPAVTPHW